MKADIREYAPEHGAVVAEFLRQHWADDHPVLDPDLFAWQYAGYAGDVGCKSLLLFERGTVRGFLGLIPGLYQINGLDTDIVPGSAIAMWMVHPDLRQAGLGPLLLHEAEKRCGVLVCLGANPEAGSYYTRRHYASRPSLNRWVAPLRASEYSQLLAAPADQATLLEWQRRLQLNDAAQPMQPDPQSLETLWSISSRGKDGWIIQGLHRNQAFWRWRYVEACGGAYHFFGQPPAQPVVVARVEQVLGQDISVLRIIEIIPNDATAWAGQADPATIALIGSVLSWAADQGCSAADYQSADEVLSETLKAVGMRPQSLPLPGDPPTSLSPVFQPLQADKPPINVFWKIRGQQRADGPWYFPKSDGDMDRPHVAS